MRTLFVFILGLSSLLSLSAQQIHSQRITLEDIYKNRIFRDHPQVAMHFSKDGVSYYINEGMTIKKKSLIDSNISEDFLNTASLVTDENVPVSPDDMEFDKTETKIFFFTQKEHIYRWSFASVVWVYDFASKRLSKLRDEAVMYPSFSPDGTKIAYVMNRDIWMYDFATQKHNQLTFGGQEGAKMNGMSDWVYEEEFELTKAYEWLPNSQYIAYISMDESRVKEFEFQYNSSATYPSVYKYKYPKAGEDNSVVGLHLVDVVNRQTKTFSVLSSSDPAGVDFYLPRIYITPDGSLCAMKLNRLQNKMQLLHYPHNMTEPTVIYEENDKYYVDLSHFYINFIEKNEFILTSEREGFNQLYLYHFTKGLVKKITPAPYDIDEVVGYDTKNKWVYYTLPYPTRADRNLYKAEIRLAKAVPVTTSKQGWNEFVFNPTARFYLHTYSTLLTPPATHLVDIHTTRSKLLASNEPLKKLLSAYNLIEPKLFSTQNIRGEKLEFYMYVGKNTPTNGSIKYAPLFFNYGGPGSQKYKNKYDGMGGMWIQLMAQMGYMVITCDNTGTGFNGAEFKKKTYKRLGLMEIQDQIDVARYLAQLPYVDANRIGHIGWSFGGFMSSLAITKGADVFTAAVAIAPVTDWRFYDNVYTERFMQRPTDNPEGYRETAPTNAVQNIRGKFLIIHGTADDNVHPQNTYAMVERMVQANKQYDMYIYPDKNHGIYGGNTTYHLWNQVTTWLRNNL